MPLLTTLKRALRQLRHPLHCTSAAKERVRFGIDATAPIRVAFVLPNLDVGGAQRASLLIGRYSNRDEVEPVFVSLHRSESGQRASLQPSFEAAGLVVHELGLDRRADRSARSCATGAWRLRRVCRNERIDIVDSAVIESDLVARLSTIRTATLHVTHLVNTTYDAAVSRRLPRPSRVRLAALRRIDAFTARWTDAFVALTDGVGESAIRELGIDPGKLVVIPRGVDLDQFAIAPHRVPDSVLQIVSLGRLAPQKGHEITLSAVACLERWGISARLIIAGEGSLLDELRRVADALGVAEKVTFAGAVDTEAVGELLARADVFCFPSRWEGQGNALLEAMASGCPVVASNIAPVREVLGGAGVLVTPEDPVALADGLRQVAEMTAGERADLGRKGREQAENRFDAQGRVRDLEVFYRSLLCDDIKSDCSGIGVVRSKDTGALRVLQVVTGRDRRGGQIFATDLAPALEDLGAKVRTVALANGPRPQLDIDVFGRRSKSLGTLRALRREAKSYDVVVAHGSTTLVACAIGLFGTNVPFIYRQISDPLFWARSWSRRLRVAAFLRAPRRVVALSSPTADLFARRYWLDRKQVSVSPNAVPLEHFSPSTSAEKVASRQELGLPLDAPVVAYVGALVAEKGVDIAIQALRAADPTVVLAVAGHGPEESALKDLARQVGDGRVRFLGALASPLRLYHAADVVVLPSRGGDSMPACLIEAGLCGLATVTTSVGAIADVVIDGETGYVVRPDDCRSFYAALVGLLAAPDVRDRLGRAARARCVEQFTIDAVAPSWLRVLQECVTHE